MKAMRKRIGRWAAALVLLVPGLLLVGCGRENAAGPGETDDDAAVRTPSATGDVDRPDDGGTDPAKKTGGAAAKAGQGKGGADTGPSADGGKPKKKASGPNEGDVGGKAVDEQPVDSLPSGSPSKSPGDKQRSANGSQEGAAKDGEDVSEKSASKLPGSQ
jgi:hypothetical protein